MKALELPPDMMQGAMLIHGVGREELIVENYRGIIECNSRVIRVQGKQMRMIVSGMNLFIPYYTDDEMKIAGCIKSIEFE